MAQDMDKLLRRIKQLEASAYEYEPNGCCEMFGLCLFNAVRSIPLNAIVAFAISVAGMYTVCWSLHYVVPLASVFISHYREHYLDERAKPGFIFSGDVREISKEVTDLHFSGFEAYLGMMFIVNAFALLLSIPATGWTREFLFGSKSSSNGCLGCLRFMVGTCFMTFIMICLTLLYLKTLVGVFFVVPVATSSCIFVGASSAGEAILNDTLSLFSQYGISEALIKHAVSHAYNYNQIGGDKVDPNNFAAMSEAFRKVSAPLIYCACGMVLLHIGQLWQLTVHMDNFEKEAMQVDVEAKEEKEALNRGDLLPGYGGV